MLVVMSCLKSYLRCIAQHNQLTSCGRFLSALIMKSQTGREGCMPFTGSKHPREGLSYIFANDRYVFLGSNLDSHNAICIFSFAVKFSVSPVKPLDQPIFWKASEIICKNPKDSPIKTTDVMLGDECSRAIGILMQDTVLTNTLEEIYGENTVKHIMTGKSVQRAFKGHLLVDKCFNELLVFEVLHRDPKFAVLVNACEETYHSLLTGDHSVESILSE